MTYTRMDRMSAEDALELGGMSPAFPVEYLLSQLKLLKNDDPHGPAAVDRYTHSLQTATRCLRDGSDSETVVCALLHDIGDVLAPENHAELAASILRPYVSEQNWWVVKHHDIFQGYYYFQYLGKDRRLRDRYRMSPYFKACVRFCQRWDQLSFDPAYPTEPLDTFLPMVREVFGRKPRDLLIAREN
jgi:predicted HD phosphohydrolase